MSAEGQPAIKLSKHILVTIPAALLVTLVAGVIAVTLQFAGLTARVDANTRAVEDLTEEMRGDFSDRLRALESAVVVLRADIDGHEDNHPSLLIWPAIEQLREELNRLQEQIR